MEVKYFKQSSSNIFPEAESIMRVLVKLYVAGKVIDEYVEARDYQDAKEVALRRNSKSASVISVTAVF